MILVRAPMRVSFVGGGTDLPDFYRSYPGRVISTTIDKFVYLAINNSYKMGKFIVKYSENESVNHPSEIKHNHFREAFLDFGLTKEGIEVSSFADVPAGTGLGSSASFAVALVKGLNAFLGKTISKEEAARSACRLEIDIMKEPIGKQDQYAAAYGGFNIFVFNPDETVTVEPVLLDYKTLINFEEHILVFYTGQSRSASAVLAEQSANIKNKLIEYKKMSDSVYKFRDSLLVGNMEALANQLHENWLRKKSLVSSISNSGIDALYESGLAAGAWGGKVLGAGGGGCILFVAPPGSHAEIRQIMEAKAISVGLKDFKLINVSTTQNGAAIMFNSNSNKFSN
ncbi:MAG: hypothetical protein A3J93_01125 [Candidatus Magasanikbacteria bacterium RIFOXYC2_FULL_42_28]|uniref:GHMP kinase n=1 Tax=Candidatus Magasanikbacteria bacterium RIFOXYC2_FULL_42_28 TaxID=1798704 RepID=A0A1F6NXR9_9BACT|nr:MAG: hypothetical protein A3J93_01125 [Candidatus Magasanikbacteria bacterium RIFOXYC2_FULL_42_28]